ncbi:alpha-amylase [Leeuwenhoekiella aestuarii]|uniref:Alpha-amylase n=1 Tax=Leeuwenhoekiella aestuarii TaxID=2249426 RepID=A0A4Q0NPV9_9FLAO|nr:alpha-amylase family glycosyl hydrolase [Leeuwenhoekiella aestuarii]RXG12288.1 alpha-amylase [Leeuwenhoekiella aestuarii]RXG13721.1 alpha-amylase [Leeuwenhoekiella aestuarii]
MRNNHLYFLIISFLVFGCKNDSQTENKIILKKTSEAPFIWDAANVYFLLTDRFNNGDLNNDLNFKRTEKTGTLRGFEGGDLSGITQKINEGYFTKLGINAIWFTPIVEQIHASVDEGTGNTYAYHGYWAKDWTALDPNFGTYKDLEILVKTAHQHGIRLIMDVVLNHTGPVTTQDPFWGENWARQAPQCSYEDYESTVPCTLVANLPDIKTESKETVELPDFLIKKWKSENRYEQEIEELNLFFSENKLSRTPQNYIIKWLTDYIRDLGIDAFRVDTVKHVDETSWSVLRAQADLAFFKWKKENKELVLDDSPFYMLGEVYGYGIAAGRTYSFGDREVDYFSNGFDNLINFQFKYDAQGDYETLFSKYDSIIHNKLQGKNVLNYVTSHDDGEPFDKMRNKPLETGTKLLLTPGLSQVYYGDEIARNLNIPDAKGDATLRGFMPWKDMNSAETNTILSHWQKLGSFRRDHPAVGAGKHKNLQEKPYVFSRKLYRGNIEDLVIIGLELPLGEKEIIINGLFPEGTKLKDRYSDKVGTVRKDKIVLNTNQTILLLEKL